MPPLVHSVFMLAVTITFVLFMAFNIGGNDVANSFGISVGTGTLSMKQALMVAAVFEVGGAVFTAAAFAFTHGSNDIANAVGPFAAILDVLSSGEINAKAAVPGELMLAAGLAGVVHTHPDRRDLGRGNRQQSRQLVTDEAHRIGVGYYSAGGGLGWIGGRTSPSSGVRLALAGVDAEQRVEGAEASNGRHCHDGCDNPEDDR